jgi:hypothetical protein
MKKGRDWSEWKKEVTGMRRLSSEWKAPPNARYYKQENTTTSMTLLREFRKSDTNDKREMVRWFLIFLAVLLLRKIYFEMTKYDKIRNEPTYKIRSR